MLRRAPRTIACLLLLSVCLTFNAFAQVNSASVTGLVTDTAGAVVPNASVTLKNKATNVETTATADSSGYYTFASLPVGTYAVTVERPGLQEGRASKTSSSRWDRRRASTSRSRSAP